MATVKKEKKVSLQVDVFVKDGVVDEVKQSAMLGTLPMVLEKDSDNIYSCVGVYNRKDSKVPASFTFYELGEVVPKEEATGGEHEKDIKFNALKWLDEPEKLEALSDAEKAQLQNIGVMELNDIVIKAILAHEPTPLANAGLAIMQHALGTDEAFPKPILVPNTTAVTGDHTDGADAVLDVGGNILETYGDYWAFCEYKVCDDKRELYRFTWKGVPVGILDEPAE